jgi:hypothetical protein
LSREQRVDPAVHGEADALDIGSTSVECLTKANSSAEVVDAAHCFLAPICAAMDNIAKELSL